MLPLRVVHVGLALRRYHTFRADNSFWAGLKINRVGKDSLLIRLLICFQLLLLHLLLVGSFLLQLNHSWVYDRQIQRTFPVLSASPEVSTFRKSHGMRRGSWSFSIILVWFFVTGWL